MLGHFLDFELAITCFRFNRNLYYSGSIVRSRAFIALSISFTIDIAIVSYNAAVYVADSSINRHFGSSRDQRHLSVASVEL